MLSIFLLFPLAVNGQQDEESEDASGGLWEVLRSVGDASTGLAGLIQPERMSVFSESELEDVETHLASDNKINLLDTRLGPLDVMHTIGPGWDWFDLVDRSHSLSVSDLVVRVLKLPSIIASKEIADREKDRAMLPVLRRCLEER